MNKILDQEPSRFEIANKVETLRFTGWRIGHASTRNDQSIRWTEITIFRTAGGAYVVQSEGVSLVYHRNDGRCRAKAKWDVVGNSGIEEDRVPCPICRPPSIQRLDEMGDDDEDTYRIEITESSADHVEDARKIVTVLTYKGRLGAVATDAIRDAMENDPSLSGVLNTVRDIA